MPFWISHDMQNFAFIREIEEHRRAEFNCSFALACQIIKIVHQEI